MGNKQAKAAATTAQAAAKFKLSGRSSASSKEAAPSEPPKPETPPSQKPTEVEEPKRETPPVETPPAETLEAESEEAAKKPAVAMPSLDLEKIDRDPPPPEPEDDPDLMAPPVFLTDAMSSLKESDQPPRPKRSSSNEAVLIATPITHDGVCLEAPSPARSPIEVPPKDDVSIDEEVSAAGEEVSAAGEDIASKSHEMPSEDVVLAAFERIPGHIPEDAASLTSSIARGEDELLKNIMGTSVTLPALTSNESVRGSVAVSEFLVDESHWDATRRAESVEKSAEAAPRLISLVLHPGDDDVTVELRYETSETAETVLSKGEMKSGDENVVKDVVASIFTDLVHRSTEEEEVKVVVDFTEEDGALKVHMGTMEGPTHRVESYPSEVSSKQLSLDLTTPFVNSMGIDDALQSVEEMAEMEVVHVETEAVEKLPVEGDQTAEAVEGDLVVVQEVDSKMESVDPVVEASMEIAKEVSSDPVVEEESKEVTKGDDKATEEAPVETTDEVKEKETPVETAEPAKDEVKEEVPPVETTEEAPVETTDEVKEEVPPVETAEPAKDEAKEEEPPVETPVKTPEKAKEEETPVETPEEAKEEAPPAETPVETTESVKEVEPPTEETEPPAASKAEQTDPPIEDSTDSITLKPSGSLQSVPSGEHKKPRKSRSRKKKKGGDKRSPPPRAKATLSDGTASLERSDAKK